MKKNAYLFIAHGSREAKSNEALLSLVENFKSTYGMPNVRGAFLELASPLIPEGIDLCVTEGATEIAIVPLMLFEGRHVGRDIPLMIAEAKNKYPQVAFHYLGAFADPASLDGLMHFLKGKIESYGKNR